MALQFMGFALLILAIAGSAFAESKANPSSDMNMAMSPEDQKMLESLFDGPVVDLQPFQGEDQFMGINAGSPLAGSPFPSVGGPMAYPDGPYMDPVVLPDTSKVAEMLGVDYENVAAAPPQSGTADKAMEKEKSHDAESSGSMLKIRHAIVPVVVMSFFLM